VRGGARFRSLSHALNHTGRHTHHAPGLHCKTAPGWRRATLRRDGTRAKSRHFRPPKARLGPCPGPLSFLCSGFRRFTHDSPSPNGSGNLEEPKETNHEAAPPYHQ
jgi:hypothetical protein